MRNSFNSSQTPTIPRHWLASIRHAGECQLETHPNLQIIGKLTYHNLIRPPSGRIVACRILEPARVTMARIAELTYASAAELTMRKTESVNASS